jgi:hypothetical protein
MVKRATTANQLNLQLEPGLSAKFRSLRRAVAQVVYQHDLNRCAIAADESPGNFSRALCDREKGDTTARRFDLDNLEAVMDETGDYTPIYYLIDKYLHDDQAKKDQAVAALGAMLPDLQKLLKQAGIA